LDAVMHDAMSDTDPVTHALADAFRRSPIAIVVFSATGVIEHVNDAMARLVGVPADLLVGRTADSVVHSDDVEMIRLFARFDADRESVALDHRIIRSDGEVRWLRSNVVQRFELFVRLVLAGHRWVSMPKFESHAQRIGRAADVDRWMVAFAAALLAANPNLELEVNVSRATLGDSSFVDHLAGAFRVDPAGSARLLLAVTEHDVAADVRQALAFSEAVSALGVGICLDEHGSVADGVRYLSLIGATRVKLTGQYVRGAKQSSSDRAMIGVLTRAARELGIEVAAPFVSDDAIYGTLAAVGVDLARAA
jgi:PAS domain S-box-containing protein